MKLKIQLERNGYLAVWLGDSVLAYGLTKEQASLFCNGVIHGAEKSHGCKIELDDSFFEFLS